MFQKAPAPSIPDIDDVMSRADTEEFVFEPSDAALSEAAHAEPKIDDVSTDGLFAILWNRIQKDNSKVGCFTHLAEAEM